MLGVCYKRIFQVTRDAIVTLDPSTFTVTNTFPYEKVTKVAPDEREKDQFVVDFEKTTFIYKTTYRTQLLCQLLECITRKAPNKFKAYGPFNAQRLRKNGSRVECKLTALSFGIAEIDALQGKTMQEYHYVNISRVGIDENSKCIFFEASGRIKIFTVNDIDQVATGLRIQMKQVGMLDIPFVYKQNASETATARKQRYVATGSAVSVFDVNKTTNRSHRAVPRQMHVTEEYIVEKDASGFQYVSYRKVASIYAIIRSWNNPREFSIEYDDGTARNYTSPNRDTLLAMLLDIARAVGNVKVIVTGEVSDSLRLMPRFAEEDYQSSIKDAFFGASSIEAWYLSRLGKLCKVPALDHDAIEAACKDLNANVPCPGISPGSDNTQVKNCLVGVLKNLNTAVVQSLSDDRLDNSRTIVIMLQTLYRVIPCLHGYKYFVEVKEVDTRLLLLQLIRFDNDFVNYWTLEVLMVLCRCPLNPKNAQQEFVNKHTLLTDKMLTCLIDLMSSRIDSEEEIDESAIAVEEAAPDLKAEVDKSAPRTTPNAAPTAHLPSTGPPKAKEVVAKRRPTENFQEGAQFFPNSLVIVGAAALLESIVSSRRDTSSPELMNKVLDLLGQRCEVLIHMLRSTSFLIMENAAILMFVLLKNRSSVSSLLKELALSEGLVLKHFYNGIFSPSGSQRFLSRFLVATWMSGPEKGNAGKALLRRMLPSGLTEYLKHSSITEEHRKNLDEMEEEFYASFGGAIRLKGDKEGQKEASDLQMRMRKRITAALKEQPVEKVLLKALNTSDAQTKQILNEAMAQPIQPINQTNPAPENYRIMFHAITQDHKLPDLIWNEQTRLELRSTLEAELKEFEREQRLRGATKVAWNYQQFFVRYESLKDEVQVGPIYVRHFLDAQDSFLRSLENPSHVVLFEKLFRRMLVNVERDPLLAITCTKCLSRLYDVCRDIIGGFDDMLLIVRMLDQATNMELQHAILDFMELLSREETNLHQLLQKEFVDRIIKYASLAHLNPDQIGNVLARATSNVLMLKDAADSKKADFRPEGSEPVSDEDMVNRHKRSVWVPDDFACPKVWFIAPSGVIPPPQNKQRGPFHVSEILDLLNTQRIDDTCLVAPSVMNDDVENDKMEAIVDTGRWKLITEYFQLRMQMLFPGKAVYSPAEVASKALVFLSRLGAVHKSANSKKVIFHPIPTSKKIMSDPEHLAVIAQLMLSNDGRVVEIASDLLKSLVEYNIHANSKLYLTGTFFFACRYAGNNFLPLANLFEVTHLQQSFHDSAASVARDLPLGIKSVLGNILPTAVITILVNYGPERFATVFTGDFDTPEVIWNAAHRHHVVEMIDQHIGDFPGRLRQYNLARYDYCPIPKIHFAELDKEVYVHEYYLRNLCDEVKFKDWPIGEPLLLLRETIERWRDEMTKGVVPTAVSEAKKILSLPDKFDNGDLRRCYRNLARKYHPDKNPNGREMFERIHVAYELLSNVELKVTETDINNVILLIKTQNIIYRRFADAVSDQKYPAYKLLMTVLNVPPMGQVIEAPDADLLISGTMLMYYTCCISPLNGKEFVKSGAILKLYEIFVYSIAAFKIPVTADLAKQLLTFGMKAFMSVAQFEVGQEAILELCPKFAENIYDLMCLQKSIPVAAENGIELIARCASIAGLQDAFANAGLIWKLIPMLLAYDGTIQDDYSDESQRATFNQTASNMHGILAAKALGRIGGYMFDELASPANPNIRECLSCLLTQPLAKLLRNRRPWELLSALNENVEKTTKIWNVGMRKELLDFVLKVDKDRKPGTNALELQPSYNYTFSSIVDELCIGGVYVRIFNKTGEISDIDDPSQFCRDIIAYIGKFLKQVASGDGKKTVSVEHQEYAVEALRTLAASQEYIADDIAKADFGIEIVFAILQRHPDSPSFGSGAQLLNTLCNVPSFIVAVVQNDPPVLWRLIHGICTATGSNVPHIWAAAEGFAAHPDGIDALLNYGAIPRLLGTIFGVKGYSNNFQSRLSAVSLLSKFLWHPTKGSDASFILRRFIPEPVVLLLRSKAGNASLQVLDDVCENPELIWTSEMQGELRSDLTKLLGADANNSAVFKQAPEIGADYHVRFRQLESEIYVGGIYIRLFLKQPTYRLSNPVFFIEKLVEFWESSFNTQVPQNLKKTSYDEDISDMKALVLGKEDFLSLMTSCIVCVVKGESSVIDHLLSWGFAHLLCDNLKRAIDGRRFGGPCTCIIRLLHLLAARVEAVDNLASAPADLILQLTRTLDQSGVITNPGAKSILPQEAAVFVELLKKIFQCIMCKSLSQLVNAAMSANLPNFLLDHVIGATKESLAEVRNPSALRIHAVDTIKAIIAADDFNAASLQALLEIHPSWSDFKDQSHDLFITDQEKTDHFLIQDSAETKFVALLTDGRTTTGISQYFSSTGMSPETKVKPSPVKEESKTIPVRVAVPVPTPSAGIASRESLSRESLSTPTTKTESKLPPAPVQVSAPKPLPVPIAPSAAKRLVNTAVIKGELGVGLDLGKTPTGQAFVQKLKDFPPGTVNPASRSVPAIMPGDIIVGVDGVDCGQFSDVVTAIRSVDVAKTIKLKLERG